MTVLASVPAFGVDFWAVAALCVFTLVGLIGEARKGARREANERRERRVR